MLFDKISFETKGVNHPTLLAVAAGSAIARPFTLARILTLFAICESHCATKRINQNE